MNNPVQQFIGISDPNQLPLLDFQKFAHMHFHVYWKDKSNHYQGANDQIAIDVGLVDGTKVIGHTDTDFYPNEADSLITNDNQVLSADQSIVFIEDATMPDGAMLKAMSHKAQWRSSRTNKLLGTIGYSIIFHKNVTNDNKGLSARQIECLYYLVKGNSIKEIAKQLSLSHRTVEHYLEAIKIKLDCSTRVELIEEALKLSVIKNNLLFL